MDVLDTKFPEVKVFTPRRFADDRGYFTETYTKNKLDPLAPGFEFVQDNESYSKDAYTVRGLHYQAPPRAQDKLVRVIRGRIFDVFVDVRKGSSTFGQWDGVTLSGEGGDQVLVPRGFLHGFMTLEPETIVAYKVTDFYDGRSDGAVHWASPSIGIKWPAPAINAVLSAKDQAAPTFADWTSPF
ncbi:MAG: dTDP-4-dehydrorhamnose 3,5-epimerase [Pseudomonadota bacterium]